MENRYGTPSQAVPRAKILLVVDVNAQDAEGLETARTGLPEQSLAMVVGYLWRWSTVDRGVDDVDIGVPFEQEAVVVIV